MAERRRLSYLHRGMGSDSLHSRSPTPPEPSDIPDGDIATPAQTVEYHRRKRRATMYQLLAIFVCLPLGTWGALELMDGAVLGLLCVVVGVGLHILLSVVGSDVRCPVCGMAIPDRAGGLSPTPQYLAALYGRYDWCDCCGTRFERYPGAVYPSEQEATESAPPHARDGAP